MAKGFMVFIQGADIPRVIHDTYSQAFAEARRFARKYPEREVLLLEFHHRFKGALLRPKTEEDYKTNSYAISARNSNQVPEKPRSTQYDG